MTDLAALGADFNPSKGFPDLVGRQFGFHADPIEPGRVWWVSRPTGTLRGLNPSPIALALTLTLTLTLQGGGTIILTLTLTLS